MAYTQKTWKNATVEFPSRRLLTDYDTGEQKLVKVEKSPGTIIEKGDEWNASNMNDLERRINDGFNAAHNEISNVTGAVGALVDEAKTISKAIEAMKTEIDASASDVDDALRIVQQSVLVVKQSAENVESLHNDAIQLSETSEAYAVGTRGGVEVDESDPTYHNNAKYYATHSGSGGGGGGDYSPIEIVVVGDSNPNTPATLMITTRK